MAIDDGFRAYVDELFLPLGDVRIKAMMGGLMVWESGDAFALVTPDCRIHLKADEATCAAFEDRGGERFKRMPYWEVPADVLEDPELFREWAERAIAHGHATAG